MSGEFELELADQRIADLRRDASREGRAARRWRRGCLARLLRPAGLGRVVGVARSATETLGLILSPSWPVGPGAPGNRARPSLGR